MRHAAGITGVQGPQMMNVFTVWADEHNVLHSCGGRSMHYVQHSSDLQLAPIAIFDSSLLHPL